MRFRHLTSAVAQILLNASSGAILQASGTLVIGSGSVGSGTSYVYDTNLELQSTLTGSGGYYGNKITIGENKFAVSTHDGNSNGGQVYIYNHDGSGEQVLTASDGANGNSFGSVMDMSGDTLVVAAPETRKVYIYDLSAADIAASEVKIHKSSIRDFGRKIGVGGGKVVVATQENNTTWSGSKFITGSAFVYDIDGTNEVQLIPQQNGHTLGYQTTDGGNRSNDEFGKLVAIRGDKVFVGARMQNNDDKGAVHVFSLDGTYETMITPSSPVGGSYFASGAIAVTDTKLVVTAPEYAFSGKGTVYVFDHDGSNEVNFQSQHATSTMGRQSVAVLGNRIIVEWQSANSGKGQLHVFDMDGSNESVISPPPGVESNDFWGNEIDAITGAYPTKLFVSEGMKTYATNQKIYVMDMDGENLIELPLPQGLSQSASSRFGDNIEVSGTNLVAIDPHTNVSYVYDLTSTNEPTSFSLDSTISSTAKDHFVLEGNRLIVNRNPDASPGRILVYNITNGNLDASFANSDNVGFKQMDVGNGKIVANSGAGATRKVYVYDIDDTTGASETIIIPSSGATESLNNSWRVAVGNGKIVVGDSHTDATFYIYNLDGSNEIAVDCSNIVSSSNRVGYKSIAIGNDKIVVDGGTAGVALVCDLDGSGLFAIDLSNPSYGFSPDEYAGAGTESPGDLSIINNKIIIAATQGRVSGNESDGIVYTFDLDGTNMKQIVSPRATGSGYKFGTDIAANDPTGLTKFANLPAVISNISSTYTLIEGQDTVITAVGTDPEGDALTWSFEEVVSGPNYVVVGSYADNSYAGAVYVYDANNLSATPTKLTAFDGAGGDQFGQSVVTTADKIIVGSRADDDNGSSSGSVYVYDANNLSAQPTKLTAFDGAANDLFGHLVATSDKIIVGAWGDDSFTGSVYVYDANDLSAQPTKLTAFDGAADDRFGYSVAASDDKIIVGAYRDDSYTGSVYVYDTNDLSAQPTKLTAFDGAANDHFAWSVAATANKIIVGAFADDDSGSSSGSVYVYDANNLSATPTKLTAYDGAGGERFGWSVSASDDKIIVGAYYGANGYGAVYVYDANDLSATPTKLTAYDGAMSDEFGYSVYASDDKIFVNARYDDDNGSNSGSVYVYDATDLSAQPTKLTDGAANDMWGEAIAAISPSSALNGVTVTQSDNVFTITPASTDANFTLRFKVTDAAGNVTTKTSTFSYDYVNKAPVVTGIVSNYNLTQGQDTVITATGTDPEGDAITWSYEAVAGGNPYIFINDTSYKEGNVTTGIVYAFDASDLTVPPIEIHDPYPNTPGNFGSDYIVATSDKVFITGAYEDNGGTNTGSVYMYDVSNLSAAPTEIMSSNPTAGGMFGVSLAVKNNFLVVGSGYAASSGVTGAGFVEVFDLNNLSATPTVLNNPNPNTYDYFGVSVGMNDTQLVVGAYADDERANTAGAAYVYNLNDLSASPTMLVSTSAASQEQFGMFVSLSNDLIAVSAHNDSTGGTRPGAVYVFDANDLSADPTRLQAVSMSVDLLGVDGVVLSGNYLAAASRHYGTMGGVVVWDVTDLSAAPVIIEGDDTTYTLGVSMNIVGDQLFVHKNSKEVRIYDLTDLSAAPTVISNSNYGTGFGWRMSGFESPAALNGTTVTQSDNVFTVTPGTQDATFTLNIKATDTAGNVTTVPATFGYTIPVPVVNDTSVGRIIAAASNNTYSNKLYAFDLDGSNEKELFIPAGMDNNSQFGSEENMAIDGTTLVVGQRGEQKVFVYDLATANEPIEITPSAPSFLFGISVAISDGKVVVGGFEGGSGIGAFYIYDLDGSNEIKVTEPSAGLPGAGNQGGWTKFGWKVAAGHGRIVVGAPMADADGVQDSGQVYIYDMQGTFINTISATDGQTENDQFGDYEIAIGNGKIAVAAVSSDGGSINSFTGSVYLYDLDGSNEVRLYDPALTGSARFGTGLAIGHEKVVVGSDNGAHFYIFDLDGSNMQKISSTGNTRISVANNRIVVGDYGKNVSETASGELRVYDMSGNLLNTIHQSNPTNRAHLGSSLAMYDTADARAHNFAPTVTGIQSAYTLTQGQDTVITAVGTDPEGDAITWSFEEVLGSGDGYVAVSSYNDDDTGTNTGAVYIYNTNDLSAQPVKLVSTESTANGQMGETDITFDAGKVIVGARRDAGSTGAVYIYDLSDLSAAPTRLAGPSSEGRFGTSVAVHSTNLIVGASWDNSVRDRSGRVYIYDLNDLSASPTTMIPDGVRENAYYGSSVTISGDLLFISSPYANSNGGAVYVYNANDFSLIQKLSSPSPQSGDNFGGDDNSPNSISVSGNNLIIASTGRNSYKGSVYVFALDDLNATPTELMPYDGSANDYFGTCVASTSEYIIVGSYGHSAIATYGGAVYIYDINDLSAQPTKINTPVSTQYYYFGKTLSAIEDRIFVGAPNYDTHVYNTSDFSLIQTLPKPADVASNDGFAQTVVAHTMPPVSALNGVTVTQSDNVLTVTPGQQDAAFTLNIKATDSNGNTTTVPATFALDYVNQAPAVSGIQSAYTLTQGQDTVITATGTDPEGDAITWSYEEALEDNRPSLPQSVYGIGQISSSSIYFYMNFNSGSESLVQQIANQISSKSNVTKITFLSGDTIIHEITRNGQYIIGSSSGSVLQLNVGSSFNMNQNWSGFPTTYAISEYGINQGQDSSTHYTDAIVSFDTVKVYGSGSPSIVTYTDNLTGTDVRIGDEPQSQLNGTTVSQSDNVLTVTPGTQDASFTLNIKATDSNGNVTSVPAMFSLDYVNQAPAVSGIQSAYTLTQGQGTVITAVGTDPEGDAITWSYEEVLEAGSSYVIVAAYGGDDNGSNSGSVYVYDANDLSAQPTKLTAFDGAASDMFGISIATAADKIVVGAYGDESNTGSVYVYDVNNLSDTPTKLTAFDAATGDYFGQSVVVTGDKIAIGAPYDDDNGFSSGSVYVYDANDLSAQPTKLTAFDGDGGDIFGGKLAVSGDKLIVSAQQDETDNNIVGSGSVYVYDINNLSATPTKLTAFDAADNDYFGSFISATADKIVVGAYYDDENGNTNSGSVYVFDANDLSAQPTKLTAFDGAANAQFGWSIAATSDKIFVGARGDDSNTGSVYVYDANNLSAQPTKLTAFDGVADDYFGSSVATTDDKIFVGALGDNSYTGSVYVYDANDLSATPTKLTAFDGVAADYFGYPVAGISLPPVSALNGVTVSQSDNVFTVTPAQQDAAFQLTFKATDTAGNVTSTTSDFDFTYVNQAPSVTGIESSYLLSAGGSGTAITATGTDPEGDAITWSFEEVMVSGDGYLVVADIGDNNYDGSVYIYNSSDLSETPTKLDSPAGTQNFFGRDFEIVGDKLIVTADSDDTLGNGAGAAFVYDMTDLSATPTRVTAPDGAAGNKFGYSVTSASGKVIISSRSVPKVYVYDTNDLSTNPTILTGQTNDYGNKVTSNSNYIFVSDSTIYHGSERTGSVYVYDINTLSLVTEIEHQAQTNAYFGRAIAANEEKLLVGGYQAGLVYVYDLNNLSSTPETTIYGPSGTAQYGISISVNDSQFVVGAKGHNSAYVYDLNNLPEYANYRDDNNPNSNFYLGQLSATNAPTSGDNFGYSVSIDDYNIVVSAYGDNDTGSVYVYDVNDLSATPTILTAFDGTAGDSFGSETVKLFDAPDSSALNGTTVSQSDNVFTVTPGSEATSFSMRFTATDANGNATTTTSAFTVEAAPAQVGAKWVIVGATNDDVNGSTSGSVYVYDANNLSAQPTKLTAFDGAASDLFGDSVAATNDKIIVSAKNDDDNGSNSGSVYVYDINDLSAQPTKLTAFDGAANDMFGQSIATTDDKIFVGAIGDNSYTGSVYVFDANNLSAQPMKLTAFDGAANDYFGNFVTATNDKIVIGAPSDDDNGSSSGSVYVYDANDLSAQPTKLTAFDGAASDRFGDSVAATADKIIVGAWRDDDNGTQSGSVYVYDANNLSATPTKLTAFDGAANDHFGNRVAATGDKIVVSAWGDDSNIGSMYVYDANDLSATPTKLVAFDGAANDYAGYSIAAGFDTIVVGAFADDDNGSDSGSVYVYDANDLSAQPTKLTAFDGAANYYFSMGHMPIAIG